MLCKRELLATGSLRLGPLLNVASEQVFRGRDGVEVVRWDCGAGEWRWTLSDQSRGCKHTKQCSVQFSTVHYAVRALWKGYVRSIPRLSGVFRKWSLKPFQYLPFSLFLRLSSVYPFVVLSGRSEALLDRMYGQLQHGLSKQQQKIKIKKNTVTLR